MRVRYVANSCFVMTLASGRVLLTDPWFRGPCQETWWNYPPLHAGLEAEIAALRPDWIYISHLHQDHLHPPSLQAYPRDTPILIGRMNTPNLRGALVRLGFADIREEAFDQVFELEPGGCRAALFGDFHATTAGQDSRLDYDLDTSLYLLDQDGARVFNAVDNTIQPADAAGLTTRFGAPHLAVLPYASASIYPMGLSAYDDPTKLAASASVRRRSAQRFAGLVANLEAQRVIPAGGEYVLGGPAAPLSRYLPQPLECELADALRAQALNPARLAKLYPGDEVDSAAPTDPPRRDPHARERDHTHESRAAYALSLADRQPDYARLEVEALAPDWGRLLGRCARTLRARAAAIGYAPPLDLDFAVRRYRDAAPLFTFRVEMDGQGASVIAAGDVRPEGRRHVLYSLDERLMFCLVTGLLSWNAMEASALIGLARTPDDYDADLHRVIVYFNLLG